ncbi:MAG: hypothetical protein DME99_05620 [Verrucomicrobia bacterium]|nr:MAG: hypothetical protein DME99_05620 [Verrucomicrobiota bacterium]
MTRGLPVWVAHASRVLVSALRRNNLFPEFLPLRRMSIHRGSPRSRGRACQHARRVRYPTRFAAP